MHRKTASFWNCSSPHPHFPGVKKDRVVDVAIIGAGITGVTAAVLLKQMGKKIALIDQFAVGSGESGHTTAHLTEMLFVATGFSGNGMTFGTIAGMLISDMIIGRQNPWAELYNPSRIKPLSAIGNFVMENKDFPICYLKDRISPSDVQSLREIPAGEGKTLRIQNEKLAVYRDTKGHFHSVSAVCTHLGCHVRWNNAEKTWDCPCHGSRFNAHGGVLNGPATVALRPVSLPDVERVEEPGWKEGEEREEEEKKRAA